MVVGADDVGAWLVAVLGDAARRKVTELVLGSDLERALSQAARGAVRAMAAEAGGGDADRSAEVGRVVGEVFAAAVPGAALLARRTVLESLQASVAAQLAVLDDAGLTGTGMSSAAVLGLTGSGLAGLLTRHLVTQVVATGLRGGALGPLAAQLNHDMTRLQGRQTGEQIDRLAAEVRTVLARLDATGTGPTGRGPAGGDTGNTVTGGQAGVLLQGRDFRGVTIKMPGRAAAVALAQLPPSQPGFTGRGEELGVLAGLLSPDAEASGAVVVSAVAGLAGVGKTTLAVHAGHSAQAAGWYPGGVLFINLHGYDDQPVAPAQALDALLRALGIPGDDIPPGEEARAGLYRSVLAQMSGAVLVIADNASAEAQVRLLLPGAGPHRVLVTSRHTLGALGARLVDLTVLDDAAAVGLLDAAVRAARPVDDRITGDPVAAAGLAGACGGLPLALHITASILNADPALAAADLAQELAAEPGRLEWLAYDDGSGPAALSVAAAFGLSYQRLDEDSARLFRLLSANPGPDVSTAAAAALAGLPEPRARVLLGGVARAHLAEIAPGTAGRWRMHDLLRLYAVRLSEQHADTDRREEAVDRVLSYYLDTATAAEDHLQALPGQAVSARFAGRAAALAWLDAERPSLTAAITAAANTGRNRVAMYLPIRLAMYLMWRRRFDDAAAAASVSQEAACRLGDRAGEAGALGTRGNALFEMRRFEEAVSAHQDGLAIFREIGDRHGEARELTNLGLPLRFVQRFEEAITAHQDAAAIFRESADRHSEGLALGGLGMALLAAGRPAEAITAHQDAAAIFRETGDRHSEGMALDGFGVALRQVRRPEEAITAHQDAAAIARETGDRHGEGMALDGLGMDLLAAGRPEEAITAHQDAAAMYRETGDRHGEATALANLDRIRAAQQA
jgi:tetratricopeptide (TPR) repeat protein